MSNSYWSLGKSSLALKQRFKGQGKRGKAAHLNKIRTSTSLVWNTYVTVFLLSQDVPGSDNFFALSLVYCVEVVFPTRKEECALFCIVLYVSMKQNTFTMQGISSKHYVRSLLNSKQNQIVSTAEHLTATAILQLCYQAIRPTSVPFATRRWRLYFSSSLSASHWDHK